MSDDIIIVTRGWIGAFHCQLCGPAESTDEALLAAANRDNPAGTERGWVSVIRDEEAAPVQCERDSRRSHFMVEC